MEKKFDESRDSEDGAGEGEETLENLLADIHTVYFIIHDGTRIMGCSSSSLYCVDCACLFKDEAKDTSTEFLADDRDQADDEYTTSKNKGKRGDDPSIRLKMNRTTEFYFETNARAIIMAFQEPCSVLEQKLPDLDPEKGTRPRLDLRMLLPKLSTAISPSNLVKDLPSLNIITDNNTRKSVKLERNIHAYLILILQRSNEIAKYGIQPSTQNEVNKFIFSETTQPFSADDEYEEESVSDSDRTSVDMMEDVYMMKCYSVGNNQLTDAYDSHEHVIMEAEYRSRVENIKRMIKRRMDLDTSFGNTEFMCDSAEELSYLSRKRIDPANNLDSGHNKYESYEKTLSSKSGIEDETGSSELITNTFDRSTDVNDKIPEKNRCKGKQLGMIVSEKTDNNIQSGDDVKRIHIDAGEPSASQHHQRNGRISNYDLVKTKREDDTDDDCHLLRQSTWLPSDQLPVPDIYTCITVNSAAQVILSRIASGERVGAQESMRFEILRVCTFRNYPSEDKPFRILFSTAGMYYASDRDEVVCYSCGLRKAGWKETDIPIDVHKQIRPSCKFLVNNSAVNVPIPELENSQLLKFKSLEDLLDSSESAPTQQTDISGGSHGNFDLNTSQSPQYRYFVPPPKHPQYAVQSVRLGTFKGWPTNIPQTPQIMAECGYYYAGFGDCVRCFHCGIGLRHWTEDDYPWIEHARWSKDCAYLRQIKGEEFIQNVHLAIDQDEEPEDLIPATASGQPADMSQVTPNDDSNQILLTDPAQSVLEMGYQPRTIKKAIDIILRSEGRSGICAEKIMETIFMLEERSDNLEQEVANITISGASSETELQSQNSSERSHNEATDEHEKHRSEGQSINNNKEATDEHEKHRSEGRSLNNSSTGQNSSSSLTQRNTAKGQASNRNAQRSSEVKAQVQKGTDVKSEEKDHAKSGPSVPSNTVTKNEDAASPKSSLHSSLEEKSKGATGTSSTSRDTCKIKAENQKLKEQTICKVCLDKPVSIVFLPCGHLVTCAECAPAMKKCPICRGIVKGMVKAFMS